MDFKNKNIIGILIYFASFVISFGVFAIIKRVELIPIINNLLLGFNFLSFIGLQTFSFYKLTRIELNRYIKVILLIFLTICACIASFFIFLASVFSGKDDRSLIYDGEKYYVLNVGWLDQNYEVYKKNLITMDKLDNDKLGDVFCDLNKIENIETREILKFLIYGRNGISIKKTEENFNDQREGLKYKNFSNNFSNNVENKNEILKNFKIIDAIKIKSSDYAIIEVDHAGARSRWFFIKILGNKMNFISELKETSPRVNGKVDKYGYIYLNFKDVNGNENKYISKDGGKNFDTLK